MVFSGIVIRSSGEPFGQAAELPTLQDAIDVHQYDHAHQLAPGLARL
jgi:hypothetical protein